jgi:hypothetical protein
MNISSHETDFSSLYHEGEKKSTIGCENLSDWLNLGGTDRKTEARSFRFEKLYMGTAKNSSHRESAESFPSSRPCGRFTKTLRRG